MYRLKIPREPKTLAVVCAVSGCALGLLGGYILFVHSPVSPLLGNNCHKNFPLTSARLDCTYDDTAARLHSLDTQFDAAAQQYINEGKATKVSVWARDLSSAQWAAANETTTYSPASLMKLPLMLAYYKIAEIEPSILTDQVVYQPATTTDTTLAFTPPTTMVAGNSYTVDDLIVRMITNSDNDAAMMLYRKLGRQNFINILIQLGIKIPTSDKIINFVTVENYANIYRMLYNASYLNRVYSEKALELMTKSSFKGIADPLPAGTIVAHKFGERTVVDTAGGTVITRELHDCGIVNGKDGPYTLCIMTEGTNFDDLLSIIKDLSKLANDNL